MSGRVDFGAGTAGAAPEVRRLPSAHITHPSSCAERPLALVLQDEYIDEAAPGEYVHVLVPRTTEWPVMFLRRPRRTEHTIANFLSPDAPANRLDILRGVAT